MKYKVSHLRSKGKFQFLVDRAGSLPSLTRGLKTKLCYLYCRHSGRIHVRRPCQSFSD